MQSHKKSGQARNSPFTAVEPNPAEYTRSSPRALVTGLKILEHLAYCQTALTPSALAAALNISRATAYRSLLVLEQRGYVTEVGMNGYYELTSKTCQFQSTAFPHRRLLSHAQPIMRALSETISQSCNLAIPSAPDLQVVAQVESAGPFGINVPIGFRYDIPTSAPGLAFAAFMKNSDPVRWPLGLLSDMDSRDWVTLKSDVQKTSKLGFAQATNPHLPDVIDLSSPIFDNTRFVAVLTVSYIKSSGSPNLAWCLATLQQAAQHLNQSLQSDVLVA